ncbi:CDP-glucose 4,6-dehydratase [Usitatibacter rugosus]|uniref:CDP-glucose 4,6-dehydratase n=1 Tax=Usitatibacter rugosus TaxID=2732067 RepID=A0A6M4H049_9PROT|nr:CDP-glucose 4,6-dehydratase [Usitatibacter rugosus]QJR12682.1 CDP-glucose 4,6-dehydratase [Usitatibacter rugosus]
MAAVPQAGAWRGRRVLVTGHTGFVGGWLCTWLAECGARVSGFSLPPPTQPSFFEATNLAARLERHTLGDVNDAAAVAAAVEASKPEVVFHLAAQPIVREAYRAPVLTFATNVMGTVHVLEACRQSGVPRIVCYTTDKVYRNDQSGRAFAEDDRLGGNEPYSASKASADWAAGAWWESYFRRASPQTALAVIRAGNIIGGGDWASERLLPDAMRAFERAAPLVLRNPAATRPWQHVLDAVRGTLVLAERAAPGDVPAEAIAWNFGPDPAFVRPVAEVADAAVREWGAGAAWRHEPDGTIPEAKALVLSSERALRELGWRCAWDFETAVAKSVAWYRDAANGAGKLRETTAAQIEANAKAAA